MSTHVSHADAAQIATDAVAQQNLSSVYWTRPNAAPVVVSKGCISDLVAANKLSSPARGLVDRDEVRAIFERTRVIDGTGLSVLRVSITPPTPSEPCDRLANGRFRTLTGWDFANRAALSDIDRWAGIAGVWPLSEETLRTAMMLNAFFLPSMKGFIDGSLIRRVTGYHLDLTTKRRWVQTAELDTPQRGYILGSIPNTKIPWEHAWVNVPKGPIAAFSTQA